ncbi:hypothetical protein F2Q70_00004609 [Brassica cretica]|uniref:DUF1985 domain-containing protein n=1 Tax=Brassica cretica TaxID=69181 RepID=A0A8S9J228_BRACR|nr:hypothetical protein F2Q70_00004609 [Brassica cretica]
MKLKETISKKPYWPSLFGKVEVATVASVIKMLMKRTVEDRLVRIKYACLAILASVLLPTNLKMKICREHAEAIADLEEFFAYPWGRLAFDMLMTSIKERDEIALSQNTITVKGFSLALQLVIVEAVPSLTEVVQEMCSSSEGDSDEEADDMSVKPKRKTLSSAHARNVDKQCDVLVRSIIDQDPLRPVEESNLGWSDEEEDEKVDNMVSLINTNFKFTRSMFVGGVTKLDVGRMSQSGNFTSKAMNSKKQLALSPSNDPGYIASLVIKKINPEFQTMDGNILEACNRVDSIEGSLVGLVHSVLGKFREEMLDSVRYLVTELTKAEGGPPPTLAQQGTNATPVRDANDVTIRNILGNISAYSTPPDSPRLSQAENLTPTYNKDVLYGEAAGDNVNDSFALSAHSHNHRTPVDINQPLEVAATVHGPFVDMPSFSLGLTQEGALHWNHGISMPEIVTAVTEPTVNVVNNIEDPQQCQKSKRQKCVPQALVQDYQYGPEIVSRVQQSQKSIFAYHDRNEIDQKYASLLQKADRHYLIRVGGVSVSAKDVLVLAERSRFLTSKVVDVLIQLVQLIIRQHYPAKTHERTVFLDSKYVSGISRTYPKFSKSRKKQSFIFPKGVVQAFLDRDECRLPGKLWEVLNQSVLLLSDQNLSQIQNPCDDGLMSVLLMSSHAVYSIEACKNISTDSLVEEGKSAAVLAFEFKETV